MHRSDRPSPPPVADDPCAVCEAIASRRAFLSEATALIASAAAVIGASPAGAAALTIDFTSALRILGGRAVYPIPPQDGASIDKDHEAILVRYQNAVYAHVLWCPHQHTALRWQEDDHRFECPKHHSKFQPDGVFIEGRATRAMDRYALRRDGDTVVVDLATAYQQDKDRARWDAAVVKL